MIGRVALVTASIVAIAGFGPWRRSDSSKKGESSPTVELRRKILTEPASRYRVQVATGDPWAVIMDIGLSKGVASIVCLVDGNASLYTTTGGGIIGGFAHEEVRKASIAFVRLSKEYRQHFSAVKEFPLPVEGRTAFYVRVDDGVLRAEASTNDLSQGKHPLSMLFQSGQDVLTQLRLITEARK